MNWMVGVDTGGTFTDVVALNKITGAIKVTKVPSTPHDPSEGVLNGVQGLFEEHGVSPSEIDFFVHGTTVSTNAVIERRGASTGLLITQGTGAVYVARRSRQLSPADRLAANFPKPLPLVPHRNTREIPGRLDRYGNEVTALDEAAVLAAVSDLVNVQRVESVAVCYLFSFTNPSHELKTKEIIKTNFPQLRISLSSDIAPIIREYQRLSTTAIDAFVGPILESYLERLESGLRRAGVTTPQIFIMQSNGGLMNVKVAASNPVQTLLSGPAGGVISGKYMSELTGFGNVVTFDVGGTSTDVATIVNGEVIEVMEGSVAGHDAAVSMNEIGTIGAGGGTIAKVGADQRLRLGPESAGAVPGPACYSLGGKHPTVTDADLVLGYLHPDSFLGGRFSISVELAREAIKEKIACPLGLSTTKAAFSIVKIANSAMEGELRLRLMGRGYDPRTFALVALGGAGPVHAASVAKSLGLRSVIVPPYPGLGSAMGLLLTDLKHQYVQTHLCTLDGVDEQTVSRIFKKLEDKAWLEADCEGSPRDEINIARFVDIRYVGQGYELTVPLIGDLNTEGNKTALKQVFDDIHLRTYGHASVNGLEIVNFKVVSTRRLQKLVLNKQGKPPRTSVVPKGQRPVYFEEFGDFVATTIFDRAHIQVGDEIKGPAIIEQTDTTIIVPPQTCARVDAYGNIVIDLTTSATLLLPSDVTQGKPRAIGNHKLEPALVEVIANRLEEIQRIMVLRLFHTGYSTILRESFDGSAGLTTMHGDLIGASGTAHHSAGYSMMVKNILRAYTLDQIDAGDTFITNDPYRGGTSHSSDVGVATPVFVDGQLIAFCTSIGHKSDVGGIAPGSVSPLSRSIFHEGLIIPIVKFSQKGIENPGVVRMIAANSRTPDLLLGDIRGQVGCTNIGAELVHRLWEQYGFDNIAQTMEEVIHSSETMLRTGLAKIPDGVSESENFLDNDGVTDDPVKIRLRITKVGGRVTLDFSGTSAQTIGAANSVPQPVVSAAVAAILTVVDNNISYNEGALRAIDFILPAGSCINPTFPAPVNSYFPCVHLAFNCVFDALGKLSPERAIAPSGLGGGAITFSFAPQKIGGGDLVMYELGSTALGGTSTADGASIVMPVGTIESVHPIEIVETEYPIRVVQFSVRMDSGGPGIHRGGLGYIKEFEVLQPCKMISRLGQRKFNAAGVSGGMPPLISKCTYNPGMANGRQLAGLDAVDMKAGDRIRLEQSGGAGWGNPHERSPTALLQDLRDGYVSEQSLEKDYRRTWEELLRFTTAQDMAAPFKQPTSGTFATPATSRPVVPFLTD